MNNDPLRIFEPGFGDDSADTRARRLIDAWRDEWHLEPEPEMDNGTFKIYESLAGYVARALQATAATPSTATAADIDLDPLEFWCDLAEVLGHPRPVNVNPASLVAEVNKRVTAATSGAREAAKEIAGLNKPNSYKREDWDAYQNAIVEIISEHFPSAVPVEEQKHPFDPISRDADECECGLIKDAEIHSG